MKRLARAFTLVEILVCIGIILVLAGLVMAVAKGAISATKSAACMTNLSQLGSAMQLYAADNDEYLPPYYLHTGADALGTGFKGQPDLFKRALRAHGAADGQFYCPSDTGAKTVTDRGGANGKLDHRELSYILGPAVAAKRESGHPFLKLSLSMVSRPAQAVFLNDDAWNTDASHGQTSHGERINADFFDGHVKSVNIYDLCGYSWPNLGCDSKD